MPRSKQRVGGTAEAAKAKFCDTLYVVREEAGDDYYFCAHDSIDTIDDTEAVAVYELKEVRRKVVTHNLV